MYKLKGGLQFGLRKGMGHAAGTSQAEHIELYLYLYTKLKVYDSHSAPSHHGRKKLAHCYIHCMLMIEGQPAHLMYFCMTELACFYT